MTRRALRHTGHDGVLEAQKVVGRGQQLQRFSVQKLLLVVRELEIVNEHRLVGQKLANLDIDFFVGIGGLTRLVWEEAIKNGFPQKKAFWAKDVVEAAQILEKLLKKGDLWYLKGSRLRHLERILLLLNHERVDCRLISCHNYNHCRECPGLRK